VATLHYETELVAEFVSALIEAGPTGTKSSLARALGVSPATITKYVNKHNAPGPDKWGIIEKFFALEPGAIAMAAGLDPEQLAPSASPVVVVNGSREAFEAMAAVTERLESQLAEVRRAMEKQTEQISRLAERLLQQQAQPQREHLGLAADGEDLPSEPTIVNRPTPPPADD
jgi:uncharacterized coiled-coil protein SlyX